MKIRKNIYRKVILVKGSLFGIEPTKRFLVKLNGLVFVILAQAQSNGLKIS